jgi:hypothetical protein
MRTIEDTTDTFRRDVDRAANRVAYGAADGTLLEAAALILAQPYRPRALPSSCSDGALRCAIYVPAR